MDCQKLTIFCDSQFQAFTTVSLRELTDIFTSLYGNTKTTAPIASKDQLGLGDFWST